MTAAQERLVAMMPQIPRLAPRLTDDTAQTIVDLLISVQNPIEPEQLVRNKIKKYPRKSVAEKQKALEGLMKHCGSVHYTEDLENAKDEYLRSKYGSFD